MEAMKINNGSNIIELLNTHSEMRVAQFAVRSAHGAITSRLGEEFIRSYVEDGNRLEFDIAEVECEIIQTVKDLEDQVAALSRRVADLEDELRTAAQPRPIWSGWSL